MLGSQVFPSPARQWWAAPAAGGGGAALGMWDAAPWGRAPPLSLKGGAESQALRLPAAKGKVCD